MIKKSTKLLAFLIALVMLVISFGGIAVFAFVEDTTATATTTAVDTTTTAADPTATEEPVATEAPVDPAYLEAIKFEQRLGIFQGDENGEMKPDATITRAEIAAVLLRGLGLGDAANSVSYTGIFSDVPADHWAAGTVQIAYDNKMVNGMGDGTFAPGNSVTYEQAVKMIVCALGYQYFAEAKGGYPSGYLTVAGEIGVLKGIQGKNGPEEAPRGLVAKLVYNSLNIDMSFATYSNGKIAYEIKKDKTLLTEKLGYDKFEGTVNGAGVDRVVAGPELKADEVEITNTVKYNGTTTIFKKGPVDDAKNYLGKKVTYFAKDADNSDATLVHMYAIGTTQSIEINAEDIDVVSTNQTSNGRISYYTSANGKSKDAKISSVNSLSIFYNGRLLTIADINAYINANQKSLNDLLSPEIGSLTLYDTNNTGTYDTIYIKSYDTYVLSTATIDTIYDMYKMPSLDISDDGFKTITMVKNDKVATYKDFKKYDIITVASSINTNSDNKILDIKVGAANVIEGTIEATGYNDLGKFVVTIDGKDYKVTKSFTSYNDTKKELSNGANGKFYLASNGYIAAFERKAGGSSAELPTGHKYAWLVNVYAPQGFDAAPTVRLFTQDNKMVDLKLKNDITVYSPTKTTADSYSLVDSAAGVALKQKIDSYIAPNENTSLKTVNSIVDTVNTANTRYYDSGNRLVTFKLNNDEVSELVFPLADTATAAQRQGRLDTILKPVSRFYEGSGSVYANYILTNKSITFTVPVIESDLTYDDDMLSKFKVAATNPSQYINRSGTTQLCAAYDLTSDLNISVMVAFVDKASAGALGSSNNNPYAVFKSISKAVDANNNKYYKITVTRGDGKDFTFTTDPDVFTIMNYNYGVSLGKEEKLEIWKGGNDLRSNQAVALDDFLCPGDIIMWAGGSKAVTTMYLTVPIRDLMRKQPKDAAGNFNYMSDITKLNPWMLTRMPNGSFGSRAATFFGRTTKDADISSGSSTLNISSNTAMSYDTATPTTTLGQTVIDPATGKIKTATYNFAGTASLPSQRVLVLASNKIVVKLKVDGKVQNVNGKDVFVPTVTTENATIDDYTPAGSALLYRTYQAGTQEVFMYDFSAYYATLNAENARRTTANETLITALEEEALISVAQGDSSALYPIMDPRDDEVVTPDADATDVAQ